jgi:hypothetical protein
MVQVQVSENGTREKGSMSQSPSMEDLGSGLISITNWL